MTIPPRPSDVMTARLLPPGPGTGQPAGSTPASPAPAGGREFLIEIPAADGTMLLRMFERNGRLAVEADESRLEEGAKRFVYAMMQWSGVVGILWKDEAARAAETGP